MTNPLVLHHSDFVYTRMKAHAWRANRSLYPTMLQADGGGALAHLVGECEPRKPLVINCQGIVEVDDHAFARFAAARKERARKVVLLNASQVVDSISKSLGKHDASYATAEGDLVYLFGDHMSRNQALRFVEDARQLEFEELRRLVTECFQKFETPQRLSSTPLLATGIFNARALITDPDSFIWPCLLMAEYVEQLLEAERLLNPRLLAVSLRGTPFAAAIRLIARTLLPIEVVDHMGPKHKILEEHSLNGGAHAADYILIGDFIVGGTELRIAEAYAHRNGSRLAHAVVLGCALHPSCYSSLVRVKSLIGLLSDCCPEARFVFNEGDLT
jgi:hypothetical protein